MVYVLILLASYQQTCMTYTIAVRTVKNSDDGQRNCPKHVVFYSKNKFEKLVHLVGFIVRIHCFTFVLKANAGAVPYIRQRLCHISFPVYFHFSLTILTLRARKPS